MKKIYIVVAFFISALFINTGFAHADVCQGSRDLCQGGTMSVNSGNPASSTNYVDLYNGTQNIPILVFDINIAGDSKLNSIYFNTVTGSSGTSTPGTSPTGYHLFQGETELQYRPATGSSTAFYGLDLLSMATGTLYSIRADLPANTANGTNLMARISSAYVKNSGGHLLALRGDVVGNTQYFYHATPQIVFQNGQYSVINATTTPWVHTIFNFTITPYPGSATLPTVNNYTMMLTNVSTGSSSVITNKGLSYDPFAPSGSLQAGLTYNFHLGGTIPTISPGTYMVSVTSAFSVVHDSNGNYVAIPQTWGLDNFRAGPITIGSTLKSGTNINTPAPSPNTRGAVITVNSSSLALSYDGSRRESRLTGKFNISVQNGPNELYLATVPGVSMTNTSNLQAVDVNDRLLGLNPLTPITIKTDKWGRQTFYFSPNQRTEFEVTDVLNPQSMFAGGYADSFKFLFPEDPQNINNSPPALIAPPNQTNVVTIVGELSPYIYSVSSPVNIGGVLSVTGTRLSNITKAIIDGTAIDPCAFGSCTPNPQGTSFSFTLPTWVASGPHFLQLSSSVTGQSNKINFSVLSNSGTSRTPASSVSPASVIQDTSGSQSTVDTSQIQKAKVSVIINALNSLFAQINVTDNLSAVMKSIDFLVGNLQKVKSQ